MRRWVTVAMAAGAALVVACVAPVASRAAAAGWSIQVTPDPPGADTSVLDGIACPTARACVAVGYTSTGTGAAAPLAERWSGDAWSLERIAMPRGATSALLFAVSCPSRRSCTAVGSETTRAAITVPLAERYNGARWRIVAVPRAAGSRHARVSYLGAVSCPTEAACAAVGFAGNPLGSAGRAVAATWAGGRWRTAAAPTPAGTVAGFLSGVSCPAPGVCTAVGDRVSRRGTVSTMALRLGPAGWSIQPAPTPEGASSVQLVGVSCPTVTGCVAAGFFQVTGIDIMLAERWDGTRWVIQHTRYPRGARSVQFAAVSCAAARACAAVGWDDDPAGADVTLAERWNGRRWAIERTPPVGGAATDTLGGVVCPSASRCEAVGGFVNTAGVQATLAERAAFLAP
jgi:hypothetical protein